MPSSLIKAITDDDFDLAKTLILENSNNIINVPDEEGNFPIHLVTNLSLYDEVSAEIKSKLEELAIALLDKGASPTVCDLYGSHPIHYVALSGNLSLFKKLIEKGEDINAPDLADETPLHQAIRKKNKPIIDFIISHGLIKLQTTKVDNLNQIDYTKKYYPEMLEHILKALESPGFENKQKTETTTIENPQGLQKQLLQSICKHIANKDPSSIAMLKICLEQSKQLGINLAKVQIPYGAAWTSCTLVEYFHWNTDCIDFSSYKDKRSLLYQYGISQMQSEWGRDVEISEARVRKITEDKDFYGDWNYAAERSKDIQNFLAFWKGNTEKHQRIAMILDANLLHLSDQILETLVRETSLANLEISLEITSAFKDFVNAQTSWEPLTRAQFLARVYAYEKIAKENILKKEIILAIESTSEKSINKLIILLEQAKKINLNLDDITVFFRKPIEYVLQHGKKTLEQKFMILCQFGFDLTPTRQELKPFLPYIHHKHPKFFERVVKLYGPNELDNKGYTYLYNLIKKIEDHLRFQSGPLAIPDIESQRYLSGIFDAIKILLANNASNIFPSGKPTLLDILCDIWQQFPCSASMQLINLFINYGGNDFSVYIETLKNLRDIMQQSEYGIIHDKILQQIRAEITLPSTRVVLDNILENVLANQSDTELALVGSDHREDLSKLIGKHASLHEIQKNINGLIIEYLEPEPELVLLFSKQKQIKCRPSIPLAKLSLTVSRHKPGSASDSAP